MICHHVKIIMNYNKRDKKYQNQARSSTFSFLCFLIVATSVSLTGQKKFK